MRISKHGYVSETILDAIKEFFSPLVKLWLLIKRLGAAHEQQLSIRPSDVSTLSEKTSQALMVELFNSIQKELTDFKLAQKKDEKRLIQSLTLQTNIDKRLSDIERVFLRVSKAHHLEMESNNLLFLALNTQRAPHLLHRASIADRVRDLATRELTPDNELTLSAAEIGLGNIEFILARTMESEGSAPYLFGINKGGAFIANYLAHRLQLHEKYLVKCDLNNQYSKLFCEEREIGEGTIFIIDDVTRTGSTLRKIKSFLRERYSIARIYTVVLVIAGNSEDDENQASELVDYAPWVTSNSSISLPWSQEPKNADSRDFFNDKEMDQIVGRIAS